MSINWTSIWEKALEIGPGILADVFADKATMSNESKLAAATQATLQSEDIAKELLPADTNEIAAVGAGVGAILSGLQTTPPVVSEATVEPVTVAKITPQVTLPVASAKAAIRWNEASMQNNNRTVLQPGIPLEPLNLSPPFAYIAHLNNLMLILKRTASSCPVGLRVVEPGSKG